MIVKKEWQERSRGGTVVHLCEGWYLFGVISLYVKKTLTRGW